MHVPIGKPLLALMSAACLAVPTTVGTAQASAAATQHNPDPRVSLAAATSFDPLPEAARLVNVEAVDALADVNIGTLVDLLTFPYHNVYGVGTAVGRAANAGIQVAGLPLSLAYLIATNATDAQIQTYLDGVETNANGAIPGIVTAINNEIAYDIALFNQIFGGVTPASATTQNVALAAPIDGVSTAAIDDIGTLVDLLTFPYHNVYAVGTSVGRAANAFIQVAGLPLSLAYLIATNATDTQIQTYLTGVQTNVNGAIPGIFDTIADEIQYDIDLFNQVFGPSTMTARAATPEVSQLVAAPTDSVSAAAVPDLGTLVDLATFPYHNVYGVGTAIGRAANAGIQVVGLPLSLGYLLATNATDAQIQTYLTGVQTNVNGAIPGIFDAIQDEIDYDVDLFNRVFGAPTVAIQAKEISAEETEVKAETVTEDADLDKPLAGLRKQITDGTEELKKVEEAPVAAAEGEEQGLDTAAPVVTPPKVKRTPKPVSDLAAAVSALGGPRQGSLLGGLGKDKGKQSEVTGTKTEEKAGDDKTADKGAEDKGTKAGDAGQSDSKKSDSKDDSKKAKAKESKKDSGDKGGRHRRSAE